MAYPPFQTPFQTQQQYNQQLYQQQLQLQLQQQAQYLNYMQSLQLQQPQQQQSLPQLQQQQPQQQQPHQLQFEPQNQQVSNQLWLANDAMDFTNAALTDYWWGTKDGKPFMEEDIIKSMEKITREESNKKKACDLGPIIDGPRLRPRKKKKN